ncbi:hypothetical protein SAMN05192569_101546 [Parageobacillus thermantarcticus]|mgnify:CR=1 FL=1|uniref:Uncharacterized protein n=1 Tax=Parageobacillus thermantarcticus TaxID=186116 RepID=A0A1I0T7G8_9BACL|nr:hypothetical protein [Parageobacillus thermantarcticus]SFA47725.1 hypothetical protein SAMN05192569_101546 [Parageobacillus thermantarcticus]
MGKWISMFLMAVIITVLLFWGLAGLIGRPDELLFVIGIIISLQCSLIITLLISILEKLPKKK